MLPDGRGVVSRARAEAENSREIFATPILGSVLANRIGEYMHIFTTHYSYRPFGCAVIIASYADDGPQLFVSDTSGTVGGYFGVALGKAKTLAKTELEKLNFNTLTCEEAMPKLVGIIHEVHDKQKDKIYEVEVAWVSDKTNRKFEHVPDDMIPAPPAAS
ncbi:20S proteasome subunit alpha 7 [Strigomonas culicis]|nr:20S proteasome subunit alpha 7 [Strigomonas culicis]|eukprot:EPY35643.1 20S proteasome subunit alpha 7 [Strigomonas culicis]